MRPPGLDRHRRDLSATPTARATVAAIGVVVLLVLITWPVITDTSRLLGDAPSVTCSRDATQPMTTPSFVRQSRAY